MDLEELKSKFKSYPLWKRLVFSSVLALIPSLLTLWEDGERLRESRDEMEQQKQMAEVNFNNARERKSNLPKLEEKLAQTEQQMLKASKKLPDEFIIDKILQRTAMIAQDVGVDLKLFDPGEGIPSDTAYKFVELPISINIVGTFGQIATFYDRIVHLELLVHIRNITMQLDGAVTPLTTDLKDATGNDLSPEQLQIKARDEAKITASAEMVIFRSLSAEEAAAIEAAVPKTPKQPEGQTPNGQPPAPPEGGEAPPPGKNEANLLTPKDQRKTILEKLRVLL